MELSNLRNLLTALAVISLTSCTAMQNGSESSATAEQQQSEQVQQAAPVADPVVDASAELSTSVSQLAGSSEDDGKVAEPIIYRGSDKQVRMPVSVAPVNFIGEDVSLNFEQAPLSEVVHAIVGDILGLDYIVDHPIKGQVTLRTRTPIPRDQLLGVLESLLQANGSLMIRGSDNRYLITGSRSGAKLSPNVNNPRSAAAGFSTIIVPLQYISASAMADILKPLADESALVRIDNARGLIMLAGTREQLDGWLDIVTTFDVDTLKGMSVGMFPLEHVEAEELSMLLNQMLSGEGGGKSSLTGLVKIIPFKSMNSVLVMTPRSHYIDIVQRWIERLDISPDSAYEKRLFVYPVQNTSATRLAEILTKIYSGSGQGGQSRGASQGGQGGVAPGLTPETLGSGGGGGGGISGSAPSFTGGGGGGSSVITAMLDGGDISKSPIGDVRVVADEENNSLMIYSTGKQYKLILDALERIDVVATQVLIEASILEVSLTDELRYGLEWTFKNGIGNDYDGRGVLASVAGGPAAVIPGFSYTVTNSVGDISAVLNALSQESLLNVISSPSVMVLDNHTAYIHVGDQVPTFDQQTESDGGRITQSVTYKDTGVKLQVTPSVNAGGLVTMDVSQSVTDVGPIDSATGQRAFNERNIVSRVAVRSNESVVLGGLIRENASDASSGVPILHKLPLVGPIFGTVDKEDRRTELLIIITPRALYNESELREVSKEMRSQIRHLELIELPARLQ